MSLKTWQVLVVTEVAPIHHTREKSQRSCTPQRLMETFSFRRFLDTIPKIKLKKWVLKLLCSKTGVVLRIASIHFTPRG
uniref:Uncharacterized protein n=1 Tax=Astyanax mexicanus TaxID=7994 RepID=A0A8B9LY53_ASTMX